MINPELENKVVLITGANHGIGAATARKLAAQGAKVFISYFISPSKLTEDQLSLAVKKGIGGEALYTALQQQPGEKIVSEIQQEGGIAACLEMDLGFTENIPRLFDDCERRLGPVDILILNHTHDEFDTFDTNSVGGTEFPVVPVSAETIDRHWVVNARAGALMIKEYALRFLRRKQEWGRIISLTTTRAHGRNISYAASKQALVSYTLSAATELGKYGITANVVCPGATQTGYISPEGEENLAEQTPLGRIGLPDDIADVIVFFASRQSHCLTGNIVYAAGGFNVPNFLG
ncbi:MAG: SDR family oxidoreductase [Dehalococcoidales bacterium]|nr:SDR family oxidoreductase [Dehalococcoidales bacterium]